MIHKAFLLFLPLAALLMAPSCHAAAFDAKVRRVVKSVSLRGKFEIPSGTSFQSTTVGGLSGLTHNPVLNVFYALSDDQSAPHFYTIEIDTTPTVPVVNFLDITFLSDMSGVRFQPSTLDPEGMLYFEPDNALFVSSEPNRIMKFGLDGKQIGEFTIPTRYNTTNVRNNLGFESLALTPDKKILWTAVENALRQDGPASSLDGISLSRMLALDTTTMAQVTGRAAEAVYGTSSIFVWLAKHLYIVLTYINNRNFFKYSQEVDPIADAPVPADGFKTNGLVELVALDDNGTFLALERSFSVGDGAFTVKLYMILSQVCEIISLI